MGMLSHNKTSFKKSGLTLDELRKKQAKIQQMQRDNRKNGGGSSSGGSQLSQSMSSSNREHRRKPDTSSILLQKSEQIKKQNHNSAKEEKTPGMFKSLKDRFFNKSDKSLDSSVISSNSEAQAQPQDKESICKSESTVMTSTKHKTGSNSNEDDVEEKKSGGPSLGDLSNEDFHERGAAMNKYSIIGNIETIIEEQNDGEIGEDSIHQLVNPKGKGERQIRNPRAKKNGKLLEVTNMGNNRDSLYQSIYQSPNIEVDENYMKNRNDKLIESMYD